MKPSPPGEALPSPSMQSTDAPSPGTARYAALQASHAAIAGDVLYGADEIAAFLFGDRKHRRRVYGRAANNELPVFRIGASVCARKSVLLEWMARQESAGDPDKQGDDHPRR